MKLIEKILDNLPYDAITDTELSVLIGKSKASQYNQIKRAIAKQDLLQIRRGLYHLSKRYQRRGVIPFELAQKIYGPSYVSFESALSYHGLIPESVHNVHSASSKRACEFRTPFGIYTYRQIPLRVFLVGVERIEEGIQNFLMATPLKALADIVYVNHLTWDGIEPLIKSLRIQPEDLKISLEEITDLIWNYKTIRVVKFLEGLKKDLSL